MKNTLKIPIIIDTDPGLDDAFAIMLAVKSNMFDIKALTTVSGNSSVENTTRNAEHILEILKRKDIPVYSGAEKPLKASIVRSIFHGEDGLAGLSPNIKPKLSKNAPDKIIQIVKKTKDIIIVTLGPLTNIALAIQKNPKVMMNVKGIVIMGGAVNYPGNMNRVAEFNIFIDPDAADIVFKFPVKKVLIPLNACDTVEMDINNFKNLRGTKEYNLSIKMAEHLIESTAKETGRRATAVYDAMTVYYLINPAAFILKEYDIHVETKGDLTRGMTVPEGRNTEKKFNMLSAEKIDREAFIRDFINILKAETK